MKSQSEQRPPLAVGVVEAGRLVGVGRTKAYELARQGVWPTIRIGRAVRVPLEGLETWLRARTDGGEPAGTV